MSSTRASRAARCRAIEVMFGRYRQGAASTIERRLLLPLDVAALVLASSRAKPPLHNLEPRRLA